MAPRNNMPDGTRPTPKMTNARAKGAIEQVANPNPDKSFREPLETHRTPAPTRPGTKPSITIPVK